MANKKAKTQWHRLLGTLLEETLSPVGITVQTEVAIMSNPPRADIVLLRREQDESWTPAQYGRLPDGVRDSNAKHILLEFKYTESINKKALLQALGYDIFYKLAQRLADEDVLTFLLSARKPRKTFLQTFGYQAEEKSGVYHSTNPILAHLVILSLNELQTNEHNAFVKCFASRKREKEEAFHALEGEQLHISTYWFLAGLRRHWFINEGEHKMDIELTPEQVFALGKEWSDAMLSTMPPEERIAGLQPETVLSLFNPEERLAGLRLEERLAGLRLEERLAGLTQEQIEAYLQQLKQAETTVSVN